MRRGILGMRRVTFQTEENGCALITASKDTAQSVLWNMEAA